MDHLVALLPLFTTCIFGALMFAMLRYVPSRKEFEAHERLDEERRDFMKATMLALQLQIQETKNDIIREVTRHSDAV